MYGKVKTVKDLTYSLVVVSTLLIVGCQNQPTDWCTVITKYGPDASEMYDAKVIGWSGVLTIGGNFGGFLPVPEEITITWKSVIKGKEKEAEEHRAKVNAMAQKYMEESIKDDSIPYPEYESYPSDLFESHEVVLVLKDKVPKKPKSGEIVITYTGGENFDVKYVEGTTGNSP